jgi:hypothetical protein
VITRREFIGTGALGALGVVTLPALCRGQNPDDAIHLLALGDWGAPPAMPDPHDTPRVKTLQKRVAAGLAAYRDTMTAEGKRLSGILALGDNLYGPLTGPGDVRLTTEFDGIYPKDKLDVPFHFVLGNHDYEDGTHQNWKHLIAHAGANPGGRWKWGGKGDATWYRLDLPADIPLVSIIALDTNTDHVGKKWNEQIQFLHAELAAAQESKWRIVVAHHPMWTDGFHFDGARDPDLYPKIRETILPELEDVVFYVSAHDHNLQHIRHKKFTKTDFFISGAGGGDFTQKRRRASPEDYDNEFFQATGFLHLSFTATEARAQFIAVDEQGPKPVGQEAIRKA